VARRLVIVSREHPDLYVYLRDRLAADPDVEMILDRRLGERRGAQRPSHAQRRQRDRRSRPDVDADLRVRSHVIITLP
jgi:hypothetical protein